MIEDELELVPFIAALDRTDQFQQGILSVVVGLFPDDVVSCCRTFFCKSGRERLS